MTQQYLRAGDAARILGISVDTLRRWDRQGRIKTERDRTNCRLVPGYEVERLRRCPELRGITARNQFPGLVIDVEVAGLMAKVELVSTETLTVVALITRDAAEELGLETGATVSAIIKSTSLIVERAGQHDRANSRSDG
jgi:molybdopterin-binding protein